MKTPNYIKTEATALKKHWKEKKASNKYLTQIKLAELCGYENPTVVNQYLNGYIPLNIKALLRFSHVLEFNPEDVSPRLAEEIKHLKPALSDEHQLSIKIEGMSMVPDFLPNDLVIIDPLAPYKIGDFIAIQRNNHILIRLLHQEADQLFLMATNQSWPNRITPLKPELKIMGRVIKRITDY